jgi:hypothetical protein
MNFRHLGVALAALAAFAMPAFQARADNYPVKDGAGVMQTFCSRLVVGVQVPCHLVQGLFGSTPTPVNMTNTGALDVTVVALPSGLATTANQSSQLTQETAIAAASGAPADAAWSGSGSGALIGINKAQYNKLEATRALIAGAQVTVNSVPGSVVYMADGSDGSLQSYKDVRPSSSNITAVDSGTTSAAGQSGVNIVSGTPTANSFQTQPINNQSSGAITVKGTFVANLAIEASFNGGVDYVPTSALLRGTNIRTATISGPGVFSIDVTGATHVRVRATSYTSGTPSVQMAFSNAPGMTKILNGVQLVDSGGSDATDTVNHAAKVNCVTGCSGGASGVAQGSTTSGQTGGLGQGATTTSAPTYTTATTNPVSLDTHGATRSLLQDTTGAPIDFSADVKVVNGSTPLTVTANAVQTPRVTTASYSATYVGLTPATSPTDLVTIIGTGVKVVAVTSVELACTATAAATIDVLALQALRRGHRRHLGHRAGSRQDGQRLRHRHRGGDRLQREPDDQRHHRDRLRPVRLAQAWRSHGLVGRLRREPAAAWPQQHAGQPGHPAPHQRPAGCQPEWRHPDRRLLRRHRALDRVLGWRATSGARSAPLRRSPWSAAP